MCVTEGGGGRIGGGGEKEKKCVHGWEGICVELRRDILSGGHLGPVITHHHSVHIAHTTRLTGFCPDNLPQRDNVRQRQN